MISKATLVHVNNERKLGAPIQGAIQPSVKSHHLDKKKLWENKPCFRVRIVDPKMGPLKEKQVRRTAFWVPQKWTPKWSPHIVIENEDSQPAFSCFWCNGMGYYLEGPQLCTPTVPERLQPPALDTARAA